jgi:hypothetical protein
MAFSPSFVAGVDSTGKLKVIASSLDVAEVREVYNDLRASGFKGFREVAIYIKPPDSLHGKAYQLAEIKPIKAVKL